MIKHREAVRDMAFAGSTATLGFNSDLLAAEAPPKTARPLAGPQSSVRGTPVGVNRSLTTSGLLTRQEVHDRLLFFKRTAALTAALAAK